MVIAVDFDGTIVEHKFPLIGKPIPFAIETLLQLQKDQHTLILWTVREDKLLEEALSYCAQRGLYFYAANENFPGEDRTKAGRKLGADLFIDDRNLGGLPDWGIIYNAVKAMENGDSAYHTIMSATSGLPQKKKKGFFSRKR